MGILRETLNVHVSWSRPYAKIVGLAYSGPALPAQTLCPFCHNNRLSIYADVDAKGCWHYCHDCHRSGDLIELAAGVWKTEPDAALKRLHERGLPIPAEVLKPARLKNYLAYHVRYRSRIRQLWQTAMKRLTTVPSASIARLCTRFCLKNSIPLERWRKSSGLLVGCLPNKMVEDGLCPHAADTGGQNPQRGHTSTPSGQRVFPGRGWHDVLTVPYYDLPERFSGFFFVGRHGVQSNGDFVFRPLRHGVLPDTLHEAGIAWLPTILRQQDAQSFVALADPLLALRLQVRNNNVSERLLPLLAWYDGPEARTTAAAWHTLEGRKVVFWGWRMNHHLLHQAIQADGYITLAGPEEVTKERIDHYLRDEQPGFLVNRILKRGKPWRQAVQEWLDDSFSDGMIEDLMLRLLPYGYRVEELCAELARPERLLQLFDRPTRQRQVRLGKVTLIEGDGCWFSGPSKKRRELALISDVIVRLDRAKMKESVRVYSGRVLYKGKETPFTDVPAATLETKKAVGWLRQLLMEGGQGIPQYFGSQFGITLIEAALAFQEPPLVVGC